MSESGDDEDIKTFDVEDAGGKSTGSLDDIDPDEVEREREERLDPDNRPEGAEVDNTQREFDTERGAFTDSDDYDDLEAKFKPDELADDESDGGSDGGSDDAEDPEAANANVKHAEESDDPGGEPESDPESHSDTD